MIVADVAHVSREAPGRVLLAVLEPVLATSGALLVAWLAFALLTRARGLIS
jgi:hypothetical protein